MANPDRATVRQEGVDPGEEREDLVGSYPEASAILRGRMTAAYKSTLYLLLATLMAGIGWASLSSVETFVTAPGRIITSVPTIAVQPLETSIIRSLDVSVGQFVAAGATLATLDPTFAQADLTDLRAQSRRLEAEEARLSAERDQQGFAPMNPDDSEMRLQLDVFINRKANYDSQVRAHLTSMEQIKASMTKAADDLHHIDDQMRLHSELVAMRRELYDKQAGSRLHILEAEGALIEIQRDRQRVVNESEELDRQLEHAQAQYQAFLGAWEQEISERLVKVQQELTSVTEQLGKATKRMDLIRLVSPSDAIVLEMAKLSVGSVVRQAESLMTLVPSEGRLEAEVEIVTRDIGFVRKGDLARVKFDAFPFQRHGWATGHVRTISEDSFATQTEPPQAVYRCRVEITSLDLTGLPEGFRLIPGLTLSAEIKIGERRVISYFLYPIIRALDSSLREP